MVPPIAINAINTRVTASAVSVFALDDGTPFSSSPLSEDLREIRAVDRGGLQAWPQALVSVMRGGMFLGGLAGAVEPFCAMSYTLCSKGVPSRVRTKIIKC